MLTSFDLQQALIELLLCMNFCHAAFFLLECF